MENALDILKHDNRVNQFVSEIKDRENEMLLKYQESKVDRQVLFPIIKSRQENGKLVLYTNVRRQAKDGTWWRAYHQRSLSLNISDTFNSLNEQITVEAYNFHLNGTVPFEHEMFNGEPMCVKCAYQWLSEEDRVAAIAQCISPAQYVIDKYFKK